MSTDLTCLRCRKTFTRPRKSRTHFCTDCREQRNREKTADRMRELRDARRVAEQQIDARIEYGVDPDYAQQWRDIMNDAVEVLRSELAGGMVPDKMPAGANSPAGPDDGCSTGWRDLAEWLDRRAAECAAHPWFEANPHWAHALHDPTDTDVSYLKAG